MQIIEKQGVKSTTNEQNWKIFAGRSDRTVGKNNAVLFK